jgi:hypothetical protein
MSRYIFMINKNKMEKVDYYCHNIILNILKLKDQINYLSTCRTFYYHLTIETLTELCLKQNVINNRIFRNVLSLDASYNSNIKDVSFMKNLKFLDAHGSCGIDQKGIDGLDLIKLNIDNNDNIKNVSFMKNLKVLWASDNRFCGYCKFGQNGIHGLNLIQLHVNNNEK